MNGVILAGQTGIKHATRCRATECLKEYKMQSTDKKNAININADCI